MNTLVPQIVVSRPPALLSVNPATGHVWKEFSAHSPEQMRAIVDQCAVAQTKWATVNVVERSRRLTGLSAVLRRDKERLAGMISSEMGKPITEAIAEIDKCAWACDHYADMAPRYLADAMVVTEADDSRVVYDPLGVILAIMPWNYPFWQFMRLAAPALAAGNGLLLKHANNVPQCASAIERMFVEAGFPEGLVAALLIPNNEIAGILEVDQVVGVSLTGSTAVGKIVAAQAGRLLKKQVLELGGSDPFIVLADADVRRAAAAAAKARFSNAGQSCISAKRFIVLDEVADDFVSLLLEKTQELRIGDPLDRTTTMGPLARANLRDDLHSQVLRTVAQGARLVHGGTPVEGPGYFYRPTILDHVSPQMVAATEETFGPLASVIRVRDVTQAIDVANGTEFGLGASIWSRDATFAQGLVRQIQAGQVFINTIVASDPRLPFGGTKQSGYGRELGQAGIQEFTTVKTIWRQN